MRRTRSLPSLSDWPRPPTKEAEGEGVRDRRQFARAPHPPAWDLSEENGPDGAPIPPRTPLRGPPALAVQRLRDCCIRRSRGPQLSRTLDCFLVNSGRPAEANAISAFHC